MASIASLLMLLAVAFPIIQSISNHNAQDTYPHGQPAQETPQTENPDEQWCLREDAETTRISQTCCPPFGSSDDRFKVTVMGTLSPTIVGCAYMKKTHPEKEPGFNLWLGDLDTGSGSCDDKDLNHKNITHAIFYCLSKRRFIDEDKNIKGWYVTLYEPFVKWSDRSYLYCGLYSMLKEDPPTIQMVISANDSCDGLAATMANVEQQRVPEGLRHFEDGSTALLFSKNFP